MKTVDRERPNQRQRWKGKEQMEKCWSDVPVLRTPTTNKYTGQMLSSDIQSQLYNLHNSRYLKKKFSSDCWALSNKMVFILYHFLRFCWKAAISLFIKKTGTAPLGINQSQSYHLLRLQNVHILACISTELKSLAVCTVCWSLGSQVPVQRKFLQLSCIISWQTVYNGSTDRFLTVWLQVLFSFSFLFKHWYEWMAWGRGWCNRME